MDGIWMGNNARDAKLEFENGKLALLKAGISAQDIQDACLTQSYLRFEQLLPSGVNQIQFPVLNNQSGGQIAGIRPNEQRLNLQDAFYCAGFSVFLSKAANASVGVMPLSSYPNPFIFTTGGAQPAPLWNFYGGSIEIKVNGTVIMPAYPLSDFYDAPQTQQTAAAASASPIDQLNAAKRIAMQPNPVFIGQKNTILNVNLKVPVTAVDAFTYIVIIAHGVLAQNVTIVS